MRIGGCGMSSPLWITYAWVDNDEGDFDYLVGQLEKAGIPAVYDKISIIPGQRLWDQIGEQITRGKLVGWAYLITPNSLHSEACREELAYAIERTIASRNERFPLIGILHGVPIEDVPVALRVRLCVHLSSPTWIEEVRAGIERRPPRRP